MKNLTQYFTSKNLYYVFLHIASVALAVQVVVLSGQNREFKQRKTPSSAEQLKTGDTLFLHRLEPVQGGSQLDTTSPRQMVFVMTTTCPFCRETAPLWKQLAAKAKPSLPVFAISLDSRDATREYVKRNNISFPVFISLDAAAFKNMNKTHAVPQTIIRGISGKVQGVWPGRLTEDKLREVADALSGHRRSDVEQH